MDLDTQIRELKKTARVLAEELQYQLNRNKKLEEALEVVFPLDTYKIARPDVVKKKVNDRDILDHYVQRGISETDINTKVSAVVMAEQITKNCLRDLNGCTIGMPSKDIEGRIFSKTLGSTVNIEKNEDHIYARNHTIVDLKSNSICSWIPKNACSSVRFSFALHNGAIASKDDVNWIHRNNLSFAASDKELLKADYTFVILRNPFKRLLSFFLDKLCPQEINNKVDLSYERARSLFGISENSTFESFVNTIWYNPELLKKDHHTRNQCDFLIYKNYDMYFAVENLGYAQKILQEKIGLGLVDTRDFNTINTTKGLIGSDDFTKSTTTLEASALLKKGKKPIEKRMYSENMIKKVAFLYIGDVLLYSNRIEGGEAEIKNWTNTLFDAPI